MKATTATSLAVLLLALAPNAASAKSIKDDVPDAALAAYCSTVPLNSETNASITLQDGTVLTGSVHCEAEDLIVGSDDVNDDLDDDELDDDSEDDDSEDDDSSDDDSEDDDSGDDSSDDDSGSDDDGGDDNSGEGGGDDD